MNPSTTTIGRHHGTFSETSQFRRDVIRGLSGARKVIPCKYLYDDHGSALFDEICELEEYYLTRTELGILHTHVAEMAEALGEDIELIELGSGSGLKTRLVLDHLRSAARVPPDRDLVRAPAPFGHRTRHALPRARDHPGLGRFHRSGFTSGHRFPEGPRAVYFPGSTIGNFRPRAALHLLGSIARLVGEGGGLLIGFDLDKDESIVWPAYNDQRGISAAFNLNLLARINRELGADFDLRAFAHRADYERTQERVVMHLVSLDDQIVRVGGEAFSFQNGEMIHTEDSYKYSLEHFGRLTSRAGFSLDRQWFDDKRYFCIQYLVAERARY